MDDGELIASFDPAGGRYLLVLAFDDVEDMVKARHRVIRDFCGWTEDGDRFDRAEVIALSRGAVGKREAFGGTVCLRLLVSSAEDDASLEQLRKAVALEEVKHRAPIGASITEAWQLGPEQMDMLEKWADEVVETYPAGKGWRPKAKTARIRQGYNTFCVDHGAPELQVIGVHGGRAFVEFLRTRFRDEFEYVLSGSNPYSVGLYRKPTAKRGWFPTIQGVGD